LGSDADKGVLGKLLPGSVKSLLIGFAGLFQQGEG
jgi:hypothetical protein